MNKYHKITEPQDSSASAHSIVLVGNNRKSYIVGRVLPLSVWIFFLVLILFSMIADARRMLYEGASLESLLVSARAGLTGALHDLCWQPPYVTRVRATERAQGFLDLSFPLLCSLASIAGMGLLQSRPDRLPCYLVAAGLVLGAARSLPQHLVGLAPYVAPSPFWPKRGAQSFPVPTVISATLCT